MIPRSLPSLASFALVAILSACDTGALTVPPEAYQAPPTASMELRCTVSVAAASLACERPASAVRGDVFLGGQGVRVKLASSNVVADPATSTVRADVTVQNLISQAIGTPDGSTVSGVRVFFHQLPTVIAGSGTVLVQNPDGLGTFTATNQPYFLYNQIVQPQATSGAKTWKFTVPSTATTFVFSVYVSAALPMETGVLRWTPMDVPVPTGGYSGKVIAVSSNDIYWVSARVVHWNGSTWSVLLPLPPDSDGYYDFYYDAAYDGAGTLYVGGVRSAIMSEESSHADIIYATLTKIVNGVPGSTGYFNYRSALTDVWAADGSNVLAVVSSVWSPSDDVAFLHSHDGGPYESLQPCKTGVSFNDVWGSSHHDVFVVADAGTICHFDGAVNKMQSGTTARLSAVHGTGPDDVWVVGEGGTMLHYDGSTWTTVPTPTMANLYTVWAAPNGAVYVGGDAGVMRYANGAWGRYPGTYRVYSLEGVSDNEVYAVRHDGVILHGRR
jgi:hypothetical protein